MRWHGWHLVLILIGALAVALLMSTTADAQCSMCRAALNSTNNARFVRNLNLGILVLLVPPVTIFCSLFIILRRHRGDG